MYTWKQLLRKFAVHKPRHDVPHTMTRRKLGVQVITWDRVARYTVAIQEEETTSWCKDITQCSSIALNYPNLAILPLLLSVSNLLMTR